jgi:predicted ATPase
LTRGNIDEALRRIDVALETAAANGNVFFLAESHRLRGEILLVRNQPQDAEASFEQSLEIARSQHAKSWELRTTMSLCRLWETQNRRSEAHALLANIYGWFTEGFDLPELVDAKRMLESLV